MILYDGNAPGPNPVTVRLFALERGGLSFDVESIDLAGLANRAKTYRTTINARGEVPALRLDNGKVITEITAICGYFDEVARGGRRLFGETAEERAEIHMWTRRMDLEICLPAVTWWRGTDAGENLYRGHRILLPEARRNMRLLAETGLNQLDDDLDGKTFIAGERLTMADILLYGFMGAMHKVIPSTRLVAGMSQHGSSESRRGRQARRCCLPSTGASRAESAPRWPSSRKIKPESRPAGSSRLSSKVS